MGFPLASLRTKPVNPETDLLRLFRLPSSLTDEITLAAGPDKRRQRERQCNLDMQRQSAPASIQALQLFMRPRSIYMYNSAFDEKGSQTMDRF